MSDFKNPEYTSEQAVTITAAFLLAEVVLFAIWLGAGQRWGLNLIAGYFGITCALTLLGLVRQLKGHDVIKNPPKTRQTRIATVCYYAWRAVSVFALWYGGETGFAVFVIVLALLSEVENVINRRRLKQLKGTTK